jgi:hypothetical protein
LFTEWLFYCTGPSSKLGFILDSSLAFTITYI